MASATLAARDHGTIALVGVAHGVTHWMHMVVFTVLPLVREEFALSYTDVGLFGLAYYGASTTINITAGPITDLIARRERVQVLSLVILIIALLAIGLSQSYVVFCLAAALVAIGNSLWHPAAIPYLANRYEQQRGYALAVHSSLASVGDSLAPAAIGALISGWLLLELSWRDVAMLNTVPALLILPLLIVFVVREPQQHTGTAAAANNSADVRRYFRDLFEQLQSKLVLGLALMAGLRATAQGGLRIFLPLYIVDSLGYSVAVAGLALTALSLGGVVAALPAGIASDRYGRRRIVMWSLGISTVLILGLTLIEDEIILIGSISLIGLSVYALRPVMLSWMMDIMPAAMRGAGTNFMFTTQSAVQLFNPLLAGFIADSVGLVYVFYYFAFMLLLANAVAFLLPKQRA